MLLMTKHVWWSTSKSNGWLILFEISPKSWICAVSRVLEVLVIFGLSYFTCIIIANLFYRLKLLREIWSINNKCQDIQKCDAITCIALLSPYNLRTCGPDQPRLIFQGGCASASCCSTSEASSGSGTWVRWNEKLLLSWETGCVPGWPKDSVHQVLADLTWSSKPGNICGGSRRVGPCLYNCSFLETKGCAAALAKVKTIMNRSPESFPLLSRRYAVKIFNTQIL